MRSCPTKQRAKSARYREKHREELQARSAYRRDERAIWYASYYYANRDRLLAKRRDYYDSNPLYRLGMQFRASQKLRLARIQKLEEEHGPL